jgi:PAS domain S-box-containing protein
MIEPSGSTLRESFSAERVLMLTWAFERSSDGIILTDLHGIILMANDAFCAMFEYPREEVIGRRTGFLKSEFSTREFYEQMWRSLADRGEWKGEIVNRTKTGIEKICFLTITPVTDDKGERIGFLGVEIDLTEKKRLAEQMAHAEQLAAIGEAMSTLAHEIRNPLNGIRMNAFMLEQSKNSGDNWTPDDTESITLIQHETQRLQELVNSVLSFARKQELHYERINVLDLLNEVLDLLRHEAKESKVDLRLEYHDPLYTLRCDPNLLKQVLLNLIQNGIEEAASYDKPHSDRVVLIRTEERQTNDLGITMTGNIFAIDVMNTGRALSRDQQLKLFKPFFTTKSKGLGLGLAASLKIARQHGGTILITSPVEELHGDAKLATCFSVLLPI